MDKKTGGKLFICGTPIGNLKDISLRCLEVLKSVDLIACEDTRKTIGLLNFYGIKKKLISYHEFNKIKSGKKILELLRQEKNIALVSDAGMPCISDPGSELINMARENFFDIEIIPGPTAFATAIAFAGINKKSFIFEGFIDKDERKKFIERIKFEERIVVFYEAPHKLLSMLEFLFDNLGNRKLYLVKELTKIHEKFFFGWLNEAIELLKKNPPKGEYVILLYGTENKFDFGEMDIQEHLDFYLKNNFDLKTAIKKVAKDRNLSKNQVYLIAHGIKNL